MEDGKVIYPSAIVLAGGRSSRMGRPKALLPFDGVPLIVHIVSMLRDVVGDVIVVAAPGQDLPALPVRIVRDEVPHQGPVGGICYGLRAARGEAAFVTSCDSAFLNPDVIARLFEARAGYDVVVPHWAGRLQPLHAVYAATVLPQLEAQLARGELRPVSLFERVPTLRIEEDELRRIDPGGWSVFNMNTPEDYARALERWREIHHAGSPIACTVELFGVARLLSRMSTLPLTLPPGATFGEVFSALAERVPALVGTVITPEGDRLVEGFACNVNGLAFVRGAWERVHPGDAIVIFSADAGG